MLVLVFLVCTKNIKYKFCLWGKEKGIGGNNAKK